MRYSSAGAMFSRQCHGGDFRKLVKTERIASAMNTPAGKK
jgi:hypothetical protein